MRISVHSNFLLVGLLLLTSLPARGDGPAHPTIPELPDLLSDLESGELRIDDLRAMGLSVFATPFNVHDGLGDGAFDPAESDDPLAFGHRPTLQGNGQHLRVNGLDAQSCNECHTIVSNRTRLPTLGFGGVGGVVQNAIIMPSMIDIGDGSDDRVQWKGGHDPDLHMVADGVADYNGRFANPPFLFGGGGVELVAKEMTADLQAILADMRSSPAGTVRQLRTHSVGFGTIESLGGGEVAVHAEGIGPKDTTDVPPEEILVVRPFGRKGENFSMRDFDRGAMQFHFGIQPVEVVGAGEDEDGDGTADEVTDVEMSVLHIFDVTNPKPVVKNFDATARAGRNVFKNIGCDSCHKPTIRTWTRKVPLALPEVAHQPWENVYLEIDLVRHAGFRPTHDGKGIFVPLFSDLKRHKMGPQLAETFERGDIANDEFVTARLWGIADSAPYLHDGRATTLFDAIDFHGGEAQDERDAFLALDNEDQELLLTFLGRLRTPRRPNQELVQRLEDLENPDDDDDDDD